MTLIDLSGQRFGKLVVTGSFHKTNPTGTDEIFWTCICDCGGAKNVRGFSLRTGETASCGCLRSEIARNLRKAEIVGLTFGRLTVVERVRIKQGDRIPYAFRCLCSCGTEKICQGSHLRSGSTKSCGCLRREMLPSTKYLPGAHFVIKEYKQSAKTRKLDWALSDDAALSIIESNCYYCGDTPSKVTVPPGRSVSVEYVYNGIDRKDSSLGYVPENIVPCCTRCNYAKRNYSHDDFISMCRKVAAKHPAT